MDCEKFETHLIDELYEELDELTSAAAKRHIAGCARCASLLSGLKATRRIAVLPTLEVPAGLEERILAAARDAQKVVPMKRRVARAISWAGSWSMRPQAAMAVLFLLMVGSTALLLKGRTMKAPASANVTVSAQGAPAPSAMTGTIARPADMDEAADNAHGAGIANPYAAPKAASEALASASPPSLLPTTPSVAPAATNGFIANNTFGGSSDGLGEPLGKAASSNGPSSGSGEGAQRARGAGGGSVGAYDKTQANRPPAPKDLAIDDNAPYAGNAAAPAGAAPPSQALAQAPAAPVAPVAAPGQGSPPASQATSQGALKQDDARSQKKAGSPSDFENAMAEYKAGNYNEAVRLFDLAAASGDRIAALRAAQTVEAQGGCTAAYGRYDQLATSAFGTTAGYDATLSAGRCFRILGDYARARQRLNKLLTVTTHARLAQNEIDLLSSNAGAARAAPKAAPKAAAPPAKSNVDQAY